MSAARLWGTLFAALGPLLVLFAASRAFTPSEVIGEQALAFDEALRAAPPEVVVVGSSYAMTDIDPARLAERLEVAPEKVAVLSVYVSCAPVWYAVLRERVYGNGYKPRMILLPISVGTAMITQPAPKQMGQLLDQMPVADAVVTRHSQGNSATAWWDTLLAHRGDLRDPVLEGFRNLLPGLFLGQKPDDVAAAAAKVLGKHRSDADPRALPGVEASADAEASASEGTSVDAPEESYLADIVALAKENGAQVAFIFPPVLKSTTPGQRSAPAVEQAMEAWAAKQGAAWIDLRDLPWGAVNYKDNRHMRPKAARVFTDLVADRLGENPTPSRAEAAAPEAKVTRQGEGPTLDPPEVKKQKSPCEVVLAVPRYAFLGLKATGEVFPDLRSPLRVYEGDKLLPVSTTKGECMGTAIHRASMVVNRSAPEGPPLRLAWSDALPEGQGDAARYWVYPGTSLTWTLAQPTAETATGVDLRVGVLGPGAGAPELRSGEGRAPLLRDGQLRDGVYATASLSALSGGAFTLSSPPDGPFLFVDSLVLYQGDQRQLLVQDTHARTLELFPPGAWKVDTAPPVLPPMPVKTEGGKSSFRAPWKAFNYCTPFRVEHGGTLLDAAPPDRHHKGTIGTWQREARLNFDPLPGTNPKTDYKVVYDPDRRCPKLADEVAEQVWLYPAETMRVAVSREMRASFGAPLARLRLHPSVAETPPDTASLRVSVLLGGTVLAEQTLQGEALDGDLDIALPEAVSPSDPADLEVVLTSSPDLLPVLLLGTFEDR